MAESRIFYYDLSNGAILMALNDPYTPGFNVTLFFDAEYFRNGTRCRHSFNEILTGTYIRPTQQCHFEWPWVTLSDLAKYSITRSIARPLCDSRATCYSQRSWRCLIINAHRSVILALCYASTAYAVMRSLSGRLSGSLCFCLSVTFVDSVETNKYMFKIFHHRVATTFSFFHTKCHYNIPTGTPPNGVVEWR